MENRRPPSSRPSGQKRYFDANRRTSGSRSRNADSGGRSDRRDGNSYRHRDSRTDSRDRKGKPGFDPTGKKKPYPGNRDKFGSKRDKTVGRKPWEKQNRIKITSDLQITDGRHHGKLLETRASANGRITSRRIRETAFKILSRRVRAGRFLEICAGPGVLGIEAISRGAMVGSFVERSARMCSLIRKNLESCGIKKGHGEIFEIEALPFLTQMRKRRRFWDVVYCNLPFDVDYTLYLKFFGNGTALRPGGILLIEHLSETPFPEQIGLLKRQRVIADGDTSLSFFERR